MWCIVVLLLAEVPRVGCVLQSIDIQRCCIEYQDINVWQVTKDAQNRIRSIIFREEDLPFWTR